MHLLSFISVFVILNLGDFYYQSSARTHAYLIPSSLSSSVSSSRLYNEKKRPAGDDFISNFVYKFFPAPEDLGLKRYDRDSCPENFPCVKDVYAALLPEDIDCNADTDIKVVRQLLAKTNLEFRPLQCIYDANRDGWKSDIFHSKVDKKGPAVVLATSVGGAVIGGYNGCGWVNYGEYRSSIASFLFTFPYGDIKERPIKLAKIG